MTIETQESKVHYMGNGSATVFPVLFPVYRPEHVKVVLTDASGVDTPLTGGYTVTGAGTGAVSVTYPAAGAALPVGSKITIYRELPLVQQLDLENGGSFDAENIERALDLQEMQIQQLQEAADRAVTVPITSDVTPDELMRDLFGAADSAAGSAASASASAAAAALSANSAGESAALALQSRDWADSCANRAESARDVSIAQVETVNQIMETEIGKINAIVAVNKDDQQAAIDMAKHWADQAREISIPPATAAARGGVRIGDGITITDGDIINAAAPEYATEAETIAEPARDDVGVSPKGLRKFWQAVILPAISGLIPRGVVWMWYGAPAAIPAGWAVCDGTQGTPNLRDRFVVGAGTSYALGTVGGAVTHAHTIATGDVTLTSWHLPSHNHGYLRSFIVRQQAGWVASGVLDGFGQKVVGNSVNVLITDSYTGTDAAGSQQPHAHTAWSAAADSRPPYCALHFIMKL